MALTDLQLTNTALLKLGATKITSFSDGSAEADIADALYVPIRDAMLSAYPWSFATTQVSLASPATAPIADYTYAFTLPTDHVRTLSVGSGTSGSGVNFRLSGTRIQTDTNPIILTYIRKPAETTFPPYFDLALIARLSAELCVPLTENSARAEVLYRLAEQEFTRARGIDAQQDTPRSITRYSLVDVRG